jgi:glyoxylase-like metal-dependent hydrolase (beta-lactamase superfamily II)/rhodanese-related sulfurtransferase
MATVKTIDTQTLSDWLATDKKVSILDIRPLSERTEWHIPQSIHLNVYENLKAGNRDAFDFLLLDKLLPIVTLCAGGNLSLFATELLSENGYDAYSLEGGMKAWNFAWDTAIIELGDVKIIQVRRLAKGCLSYIIGAGHKAMVIDASLHPSIYLNLAVQHGYVIEKVADTHIHADYVSRTKELAKATGAAHLMLDLAKVNYNFTPIKNGVELDLGETTIKVIHTPGHTLESTSFLIEDSVLLTGDTLFIDSVGRPDLKANEHETWLKAAMLYDTLHLITALNDNVEILPAHTSKSIEIGQGIISSSLGQIKKSITMLSLEKEMFIETVLSKLPPTPANYLQIAEINRNADASGYSLADLEAGANRCAIQ